MMSRMYQTERELSHYIDLTASAASEHIAHQPSRQSIAFSRVLSLTSNPPLIRSFRTMTQLSTPNGRPGSRKPKVMMVGHRPAAVDDAYWQHLESMVDIHVSVQAEISGTHVGSTYHITTRADRMSAFLSDYCTTRFAPCPPPVRPTSIIR